MERKNKIFIGVSSIAFLTTVVAIVISSKGNTNGIGVFGADNEVWYHYKAVEPTENTHGSKEFWASSKDNCATHTFTNPGVSCEEGDFSTKDGFNSLKFGDPEFVPSLFDARNAVYPTIDEDDNTVTYGIYPQSNVNDSTLISALDKLTTTESNGWYLYEGSYYAKVSATPWDSNYTFDNGATISSDTIYWFKCKPITWNILTNNYVDANGNNCGYYLTSSVLLDAQMYDEDNNNYKDSDIRNWLNDDFYKSAFALNSKYINQTVVDNSASTTDDDNNGYACENTNDYVFLLSYKDCENKNYFSDKSELECKTTDYARAVGAWAWDDSSYYNNGYYWTRSPCSGGSNLAWYVRFDGDLFSGGVRDGSISVRPSLSLSIA